MFTFFSYILHGIINVYYEEQCLSEQTCLKHEVKSYFSVYRQQKSIQCASYPGFVPFNKYASNTQL